MTGKSKVRILCVIGVLVFGNQITPAFSEDRLDDLMTQLSQAENETQARDLQAKIRRAWSRSGSDSMDLLFQRGQQAHLRGDREQALDHYSRLIAFDPDFAEAWNARAKIYFIEDKLGHALFDLRQALRAEPRHFGALAGVGMLYEKMEKPDLALKAYRAALELNPFFDGLPESVERLALELEGQPI